MSNPVTDNTARSRFELVEQGETAFANYRRQGDVVIIPHVEAPMKLRGKGTAERLMAGIVEHARAEHFRITPWCSYAAAWFRRHPENVDLLAD
jgi:predicted GNAT family acetyltransferase